MLDDALRSVRARCLHGHFSRAWGNNVRLDRSLTISGELRVEGNAEIIAYDQRVTLSGTIRSSRPQAHLELTGRADTRTSATSFQIRPSIALVDDQILEVTHNG